MASSTEESFALESGSRRRHRCFADYLNPRLMLLCGVMLMAGCGEPPSSVSVEQDELLQYLEENPEAKDVSAEDTTGF